MTDTPPAPDAGGAPFVVYVDEEDRRLGPTRPWPLSIPKGWGSQSDVSERKPK